VTRENYGAGSSASHILDRPGTIRDAATGQVLVRIQHRWHPRNLIIVHVKPEALE